MAVYRSRFVVITVAVVLTFGLGFVSSRNCRVIQSNQELNKALAEIGWWEALCENLGVEKAILNNLRFAGLETVEKKRRCLQAFLDQGDTCWETVVGVVAEFPFHNRKLANRIAEDYGVNWPFEAPPAVKTEDPSRKRSPPTPNEDVLEFGHFVQEAVIALDKALTGESGEITVHDRRIKFKAKWRVHSFDEPIVWDATAQDMETGIKVEAKHYDTDRDANLFAVRKLCEALKNKGILHDVHDEL